jgi:hypothetical protein
VIYKLIWVVSYKLLWVVSYKLLWVVSYKLLWVVSYKLLWLWFTSWGATENYWQETPSGYWQGSHKTARYEFTKWAPTMKSQEMQYEVTLDGLVEGGEVSSLGATSDAHIEAWVWVVVWGCVYKVVLSELWGGLGGG